jgi:hypothetical protein
MWRRARTILWTLSLLIFLGATVLWARTYFARDSLVYNRPTPGQTASSRAPAPGSIPLITSLEPATVPGNDYIVTTAKGEVGLVLMPAWLSPPGWSGGSTPPEAEPPVPPGVYGFCISLGDSGGVMDGGYLFLPLWFVTIVLLLPVVLLRPQTVRTRRRALGLCVWCGYDIRATPNRCPECGAASANSA